MSRLITRFVVFGIFLTVGWVSSQIKELGPCGGRAVDQWFDESDVILAEFDYDLQLTEQAYLAQQNVETPECLLELQAISVDLYYNAWLAEQAFARGDIGTANYYDDQALAAYDQLELEIERLIAEQGWE